MCEGCIPYETANHLAGGVISGARQSDEGGLTLPSLCHTALFVLHASTPNRRATRLRLLFRRSSLSRGVSSLQSWVAAADYPSAAALNQPIAVAAPLCLPEAWWVLRTVPTAVSGRARPYSGSPILIDCAGRGIDRQSGESWTFSRRSETRRWCGCAGWFRPGARRCG
jgi:hypothetical protein